MSQSAAKYTSRRLLDVKKVLLQMQAEPSKDGVLKVILEALVLAGFDRARAFHYAVDNHAFEPLECAGMQDRQKFFSAPIDIHRSFYANQTFSDWSQTKEAKRIYPDVGHLDPYENQLDKVAGWPWAQTPLVIHGKLYGYLAADNHIGRHPITQDMLDFLTVMGVLTAQAIQNEITHIVDK